MKLSVHFIAGRRYWKAGEGIPDDQVPARIAEYAVSEDADAQSYQEKIREQRDDAEPGPIAKAPKRGRRYVLRKGKRMKIACDVQNFRVADIR